MRAYPTSLQSASLMAHMEAICKGIGPRPSTSDQERRAADYVAQTLRRWGIHDIQRQRFKSQNSAGWTTIPSLVAGFLAAILGMVGGQWGKILISLLFIGSAHTFRQSLFVKPPFFHRLITRWTSQNVIATVPAAGAAQQTLILVGHLDSQKQRFQFPPPQAKIQKAETSLPIVAGFVGGVLSLITALFKPRAKPWWLWPMGAAYAWGLGGALYDEAQPHVEGANDNATAVSVLLGIGEALRVHPLQRTNVILLFTGCEEVGCVGMERYLQRYAPSPESSYWIDVEMVGTGNLCYVTQHGISYVSTYTPHSEMVEMAERVAQRRPELEVTGKDMVMVEEIANLWRHGYKAVCLAGYNEAGALPNWHRLSDNLDNIEPETLSRAARYTWDLVQEIDHKGAKSKCQP
jgi:hypothetical protein